MWQKQSNTYGIISNDFVFTICIILLVIGGITHQPILFLFVGLIALYVLLNHVYHRAILQQLELIDKPNTIRLFPGDEAVLPFSFKNHSLFPFINGIFRFHTNESVKMPNQIQAHKHYSDASELPLSLLHKGKSVLEVPFQ